MNEFLCERRIRGPHTAYFVAGYNLSGLRMRWWWTLPPVENPTPAEALLHDGTGHWQDVTLKTAVERAFVAMDVYFRQFEARAARSSPRKARR